MAKRQVMFTFTPETSAEPIIYNIGQQFNILTNIHEADASEDRGWIVVELEGEDKDIEAAVDWAISKGVRVDLISDETAKG
jgi:ABC-type methionine transport system ATPase subunit